MLDAFRVDAPLGARARFVRLLVAWSLLLAASPGLVVRDGAATLALAGAVLWAVTVVRPVGTSKRPRRAAFLAEWAAACYGFAGQMVWLWYVIPFGFLYPGIGQGLYAAGSGLLARRVTARRGPAAGAFVGVVALEFLRTLVDTPLGLGWQRVAHCGVDAWLGLLPWTGIEGTTLVVACLAGAATLALGAPRRGVALALVPLALVGLGVGRFGPASPVARASGEALEVLCVQPGFSQARKQFADPRENFLASRELTLEALDELARAGRTVDLVVWGESMLYVTLLTPAAEVAMAAGTTAPAWDGNLGPDEDPRTLLPLLGRVEREWVHDGLLRFLPEGVSFAGGAEVYDDVDGVLRRRNSICLWDAAGERVPIAAKRILVPTAETLYGFEHVGLVRDVLGSLAGYVPDFVAADETAVLPVETRAGRGVRLAGTVCFDNAFERPYVGAEVGVDAFLVVSNEAWYRNAFEMDQMVAFTRALAATIGRPFLRATNSGVTVLVDATGAEGARLEEGGLDRGVAGTLAVAVPLPADREARTLASRLRRPLRWALAALLAVLALSPAGRRRGEPSKPAAMER